MIYFRHSTSFPKHQAYASQIGKLLDVPFGSLNLEVGRYAKRIATAYQVSFSSREDGSKQYWDFFFKGWDERRYFVWQLKAELVEAINEQELFSEERFTEEFPIEATSILFEGAKKSVIVNSYERNPIARQKCINHWKARCSACDFDFEAVYEPLGRGFIHVHHLTPISQIGKAYQINPIEDLRPVCPNCHAMLHKHEPPISIEELKAIIIVNKL